MSEKRETGTGRPPAILCDRFVLAERLEQGRFGTMYRALDRLRGQDGRADVAVLILPTEIARSPEKLAAFEHELESVRVLSHPNIVRIFSLERDGDIAFLVLEWVDGESLRSVIESLLPETVCEADALGVVRAVGNALVYAHARGLVHGDIRPENVLVTERGEVRLLFASACLATAAPFRVTPRDDVRGLAALAYELMTGEPPPIGALYPRGRTDEPDPIDGLSRKRWKALKSALSMRDGRISSVRRLLAALDLPEPRAPRRGSRPDRIRDARRGGLRRTALAAAAVAGVAALAAIGASVWTERRDALPDLSGLPASVGSGAGRAADLTREGLAGAKAQLERAGSALAAFWGEVGERVEALGAAGDASPPAAAENSENDALPAAELLEPEPLNGIGDGAAEHALDRASAAERGEAAAEADDDTAAGAAPGDREAAPQAEPAGAEPADGARAGGSSAQAPVDPPARTGEPPAAERAQQAAAAEARSPASAEASAADPADSAPPRVRFSRSEYVVSEGDGVAAVEVRRDGARGELSFVWWTRDGSARSGDDYADLGRRVERFGDGETVRTLYVPITSDSIAEDTEYFEILVGVISAEGNQNGALESARVTIVDDDR